MGTSTQPNCPSTTAKPFAFTFNRRESSGGGSVGTNLLPSNNVTVTSCEHLASCRKKKEDQESCKASSHNNLSHAHAASMQLTADCDCHNIIMAPKNVNDMQLDETDSGIIDGQEIVVEEDCMSSSGSRRRISTISSQEGLEHDMMNQVSSDRRSNAHSCPPLTCPLQASASSHQTTKSNTMVMEKYPLFPTTAFAMSSPPSVTSSSVISPNVTKVLHSMQQIINLNQSAINHSLSGGGNDDWAFDTLHKAEWIRCHLDDELATIQQQSSSVVQKKISPTQKKQHHTNNAVEASRMNTRSFKKRTSCLSNSWTSGSSTSPQMRRVGSNGSSNNQGGSTRRRRASMDVDKCIIAKNQYQYQRMDFDEGMHSFVNLENIDAASFWLPMSIDCNSCSSTSSIDDNVSRYEMSPMVEATLVFNIGQVHRRKSDLDAAYKCYEQAFEILKSSTSTSTSSNSSLSETTVVAFSLHQYPLIIPILHNIGQLRYRRGDIQLAMESYTMALSCSQLMFGECHPHVASALNCLGVLHYHNANMSPEEQSENVNVEKGTGGNGNDMDVDDDDKRQNNESTKKAMELFEQALAMRIATLGPNHVDVATVLNNIGRIHVQRCDFDLALEYYQDAMRIRRQVLGSNSLDYAATAFNAGQSFHQQGDLTRAAELYNEFLRVALMNFGNSHRDVAVVLSGIAQIHQEKKEYDQALELYEASLCAGKAALGEEHPEIATLLNRLGNFHFEQGRLEEALLCYERGLQIERKVLPPDCPNIVVTLSNLGEIHRQRSEWDEAAKMYHECLTILRRTYDNTDQIDVASTLSTLGLIHDQRGDTCKSLHFLQDALFMRRRLLGCDHLDVSATLVYLGTILYRKSIFSTALELFSESLRIRQSTLGKVHRDVAFVLYNIALVHQQCGSYDEAIESYSETLRIERLVLGENHRDISMTLFKLGEVHKVAGDLEEALKYFKNSLEVERSLSSSSSLADNMSTEEEACPDYAAMARALNEIGNIHLALGNVVEMMEAFNEASRLYRTAGLSPHNVVVSEHLYALEISCPEAAPAA